jgi:hypothetical protein
MRKVAVVLAAGLALAIARPAAAQIELGMRAGASIADLDLDLGSLISPDLDSRTGFLAEVFLDFPIGGGLSLEAGAAYVQKGAGASSAQGSAGIELAYLELPLLLKYGFPTSGAVGVHLQGGPAVAIETSCKLSVEGNGFELSGDCEGGEGDPDEDLLTESVDVGILLGGGLSFDLGSASLIVDLFYDLGLRDVAVEADASAKNRAFYITAGVAFPIG